MRKGLLGFLWVIAGVICTQGAVLFEEHFDNKPLSEIWKPKEFEGQTEYRIVHDGTNGFLEGSASSSASGLGIDLKRLSADRSKISFRWKIDKIPPQGSERDIDTFDHTARIFVAFKTFIGPPRTVNYVWANQEKAGATFHHPNSGRARFIVLESGNGKAGQWIEETRDLAADWKRLFGDDEVPDIVGVGLMTDADGTKSHVTGCYDDIVISTDR